MERVCRTIVVKKELSRKAKLSPFTGQSHAPTLTYGHEFWVPKHLRNTFSPKIALLDGINWASSTTVRNLRVFYLIRICPSTPILSIFQGQIVQVAGRQSGTWNKVNGTIVRTVTGKSESLTFAEDLFKIVVNFRDACEINWVQGTQRCDRDSSCRR
ncbi:hypothetical protein L3Q82_020982 [Scortum barcoo]|uniref:Uncharacterized protein n=1 Tax=Scortum barcoo TaxID=214431 RepID=A0ACB8V9C8_9TELE|nr:hypothetical protein L3Q82_020982 [Scortum barcoo]